MVYVFHSIDNFRDVADCVQRRSRVCSKNIFRSATLDFATEEDLEKLTEELKVNTIIDLRSEVEAQISKLGKPFVSFPVAAALKLKPSDMTEADPEPSVHEKTDGPARKTIMINFAGQKFRKYAVWKAAPLKTKMQIVGLIASGQKPKAVKLVGEEIIAKKGLSGLYRDFIDYCDQEICEALQVLADPSNYPVLVHCTQGKDRTGLVTALALAAAGIEEEKIIEDYHKSQKGLDRVRDHMVREMGKDGLDPSFADAPADVMIKTFEYIREKYTDVNGYLDYIGFGEKERIGLSKALTFEGMRTKPAQDSAQRKASDGATLERKDKNDKRDRSSSERTHDRRRSESADRRHNRKDSSESDTSSGSSTPWSPDSRDKPNLGRSLGVPIGGSRRHRRSGSGTPGLVSLTNPRVGAELLASGLGLNLPPVEECLKSPATADSSPPSSSSSSSPPFSPPSTISPTPAPDALSPLYSDSPSSSLSSSLHKSSLSDLSPLSSSSQPEN